MKFILEAYLDDEEKFYDYGTAAVDNYKPDNLFDQTRTGFSFYDNFLNDKDLNYMKKNKNLTGQIEYMTPAEYFSHSSQFHNRSSEREYESVINDTESMNNLRTVVKKYKRQLNIPYLNFANQQQEGNHRMALAAEMFGWDTKFPVLCIYHYN